MFPQQSPQHLTYAFLFSLHLSFTSCSRTSLPFVVLLLSVLSVTKRVPNAFLVADSIFVSFHLYLHFFFIGFNWIFSISYSYTVLSADSCHSAFMLIFSLFVISNFFIVFIFSLISPSIGLRSLAVFADFSVFI